jgi:predicted  nucleic acid-binding Zn-ribbon protein
VLDQKNQVDAIETQIKARRQEQDSIAKDQARMRENMKALKGSAEEKSLLQRYTRQLDSQEDRLNTLQEQISDLQERKEKAEAEFEQTIQQISLDETL